MSSIEQLRALLGEIQELEIRLRQIEALYLSYRATFQNEEQRDLRDAVLLADIATLIQVLKQDWFGLLELLRIIWIQNIGTENYCIK